MKRIITLAAIALALAGCANSATVAEARANSLGKGVGSVGFNGLVERVDDRERGVICYALTSTSGDLAGISCLRHP